MLLRASTKVSKILQATIKESEREINFINGRLDTNDRIFSDLKTTLTDCIEKAILELSDARSLESLNSMP